MEYRDRLAPWIYALRRDFDLLSSLSWEQIAEASTTGVLWLQWPTHVSFVNDRDPTQKYEAVELLALLARVDYTAVENVLMELWPAASPLRCHRLKGTRVSLGVEVSSEEKGVFSRVCERLVETDVELFASSDYINLRRGLEAALQLNDRTVEIPVRLVIGKPEDYQQDHSEELWREIRMVVAAQANNKCDCGGSGRPRRKSMFRITDVDLGPYIRSFEAVDLVWVRKFATKGIHVSPIVICGLAENDKTIETMDHLLRAETSSVSLNASFRTPTKALVTSVYDAETMDSAFSSLLDCESIRDVELPSPSYGEHNTRWWRWIAVVFFHVTAKNMIKQLAMAWSRMSRADVAAFVETMSAQDPLATLFPRTSSVGNQEQGARTVDASRFRISQDINGSHLVDFGSSFKTLRVIDDDVNELAVLLPGVGKAWVARDHATITKPDKLSSTNRHPLHIEVKNLHPRSEGNFDRLCRAMDHRMRKLTITNHWEVYSTMGKVLPLCPHLEELEMKNAMLESLEDIVRAYETDVCQAKTLVFKLEHLGDSANTYRFFERLADPNHPMTKHIRVLRLVYGARARDFANIESAVLRMLQRNRFIYEFHLKISLWRSDASDRIENVAQAEFDRCDGELVFDRLALPKKLAFLSVVEDTTSTKAIQASGTSSSPRLTVREAIYALDTSVISSIFQFAGESRQRWVRVQF